MQAAHHPSPNHDARPPGVPIDMLVLHYTGMTSGEAALERLCDPAAKVSAHYMIEEDGRLFILVPESRRAWHAGLSCWAGATDVNARSIGIELVNPGHEFGYRAFPEAQMATLADLAWSIQRRRPIPPANVVGHSDVAPARKQDPGELFDWVALARAGIGLWPGPEELARDEIPVDEDAACERLGRIGYCLDGDAGLEQVLAAFQRHFRPSRVDGTLDSETMLRLTVLAEMVGRSGVMEPGRNA